MAQERHLRVLDQIGNHRDQYAVRAVVGQDGRVARLAAFQEAVLGRETELSVVVEFVIARSPRSGGRSNPGSWIATPGCAGLAMTGQTVPLLNFPRLRSPLTPQGEIDFYRVAFIHAYRPGRKLFRPDYRRLNL